MNIGELVAILRVDDSEMAPGISRGEERMNRLGGVAAGAGAAAGGALGAGLSAAMAGAIELDSANAKLEAQLGGAGPVSARAGEVAGQLYANAYGESMSEVNDAVRLVMTNVQGMSEASAEDLQQVTGVTMSLAQAFDQDLGGATRAVDQMLRTGLASSAEEALDILARGFQTGVNEADDLLDTMSEYSTVLRDVGLDGETAMGLLQQGLQGGARDADTVADALKEFAILGQDGSDGAAEAFEALGINASAATAAIAAGGSGAATVLDQVLDGLRNMEDPVARNATAVGLFGTKAEDLGDALFSLDPTTAVAALGQVGGAAAALDATLGDTAAAKVTAIQRSWEQWSASLIATEGPMGMAAAGVSAFGPAALGMAGSLAMVGMALGPLLVSLGGLAVSAVTTAATWAVSMLSVATNAALAVARVVISLTLWAAQTAVQGAVAVARMAVTAGAYVASWVLMGVQATARAAVMAAAWVIGIVVPAGAALVMLAVTAASYIAQWVVMAAGATARALVMAAAWLIAMGPVGAVIAIVVGLVALIVANWDTIVRWTTDAWRNVTRAVGDGINGAVSFVRGLPGQILGVLSGLGTLLLGSGGALVDGFLSGIRGAWDAVVKFVRQGVQWVRDLFPFSPAKTGPFSGSGYVTHSGKALTGDFADSLRGGMPGVVDAARKVMDATHLAMTPTLDSRATGLPGDGWLGTPPSAMSSYRGGDRVVQVTVNNPIAERASDSVGRSARSLAALGPWSGQDGAPGA